MSARRAGGPLEPGDPDRMGRWLLQRRLGRGSATVVYQVINGQSHTAALKTGDAHISARAREALAGRLRREAAALRQVGGPGVVRLAEDHSEASTPHLVLELLAGPTLAAVVARTGGLRVDTVLRLGASLARAVADLHQRGVTHGDLKPANIVCSPRGPVLIDLDNASWPGSQCLGRRRPSVGTASRDGAEAGSEDTCDMWVRATPAWLAPEVAQGMVGGPAADVFGLGAVLANASSGRAPFGDGSLVGLLARARHQPPNLAGVAPTLVPLLVAALERSPANRPGAAELAAALVAATLDSTDRSAA